MIVGDAKFRQYVRQCRELYPITSVPVRVRRVAGKVDGDACATTELRGRSLEILIWRGMCKQATVDALMHEWAHAWLYDGGHPEDVWMGHGPEFWAVMGEFYRAWRV